MLLQVLQQMTEININKKTNRHSFSLTCVAVRLHYAFVNDNSRSEGSL
ncbi:hypothetical protein HMPREF9370_1729 [Neisseria wadsworthii 9715]|uniref:Uncharacterized protein n=1 Tax=Neisseria wadsworthii 9715 TaxID=1030841 RepID=G4CRL9_9NEIS|nr:hypothetical protein HMPREF9370_1729 [Neisseria wadsworthii 9715]